MIISSLLFCLNQNPGNVMTLTLPGNLANTIDFRGRDKNEMKSNILNKFETDSSLLGLHNQKDDSKCL